MTGVTIMFGGPIQYASRVGDVKYDPDMREQIDGLITALEHAEYTVLSAHRSEDYGQGTVPPPGEVTERDFRFLASCDVYVGYLPCVGHAPFRSDGTHIELGWASAMGKPCVILYSSENAHRYSFVLQGLPCLNETRFLDLKRVLSDRSILLRELEELTT